MAVTIICPNWDLNPWITVLNDQARKLGINDLDLRVWPDDGPGEDVEMALTWAHPPGVLKAYPNLQCISSMGAGVDHLLSDPDLPEGVPVVRLVDTHLIRDMAEYVLLAVLSHFRQLDIYQADQSRKRWQPRPPMDKADCPVGIMGLGQLGTAAALRLTKEGFPVAGWRNTEGGLPGVTTFHGQKQLPDFLSRCRVLICLLPLTSATRHILNLDHFAHLPSGAYLINVGRGGHLKEEDLIPAMDKGLLSGACLDVFETEPLPGSHPFWAHPRIRITPHVSSQTDPASVAPQILENLERLRNGKALANPVNLEKGY
ncbi:MAG: glyoxylate/hydroxypyruvate reductase A [Desulfobacterales bacterium]|nr:glyoxylate/hydroxypyruvate reductase A [Desulfobacterales bacterium]